jgi:hypothetical protein
MRLPAVLALAVVLTACSSGSKAADPGTSTPTPTPTTSTAGVTTTATTAPTTPTTASPTPAPGPVVLVAPKAFNGAFTTPSGNAHCELSDGYANCKLAVHPWPQKPIEDGCAAAKWDTSIVLYDDGAILRGECAFDPPRASAVLAYGHALQVGSTRCVSETTGVECLLVGTSTGFVASRATYTLTAPATPLTKVAAKAPAGTRAAYPRGFFGGFTLGGELGVCDLDGEHVECLPYEHSWKATVNPESCVDGDKVDELDVTGSARGETRQVCRSDSLGGGALLPAGHTLQIGDFACTAGKADVTCKNVLTGHGFTHSKAAVRTF